MRKNTGALDLLDKEWCLISVFKKSNEEFKEALSKSVRKETNINIDKIHTVSKNYYIAELSDNNVNNIQRNEYQLLNFFTPSEANNLPLTSTTKEFLKLYSNLI